ncbi:hypothetical protein EDD86DRAFT_199528 [Gorgonomyces haynaldii]|nr:hypothetical protein EDD86DRAFT_199528 [Gorgonomyces haynaldii]
MHKNSIKLRHNENDIDDDLDALIAETIQVQEDSADAAVRALKTAQMTEQIAASQLTQLKQQGEQLKAIDSKMDLMDAHSSNAGKQLGYLEKLARNFMIPVFSKQPKQETPPPIPERTVFPAEGDKPPGYTPRPQPAEAHSRLVENATTEQHEKSKQAESIIDQAMTGLSSALGNIKMMALSMESELIKQNEDVQSIDEKASVQKDKVDRLNARVGNLLKK